MNKFAMAVTVAALSLGASEAFAQDYYAKGFRMIAHASDFGLMQSALSQRLQGLSKFADSGR